MIRAPRPRSLLRHRRCTRGRSARGRATSRPRRPRRPARRDSRLRPGGRRRSACTSSSSPAGRSSSSRPGSASRRTRLRLPVAHRRTPDGVVSVARGRALTARRPLPRLGPAARARTGSPSFTSRTPAPRLRRRPARRRARRGDPAHAARPDRARARRLRAAASVLPLPRRCTHESRSARSPGPRSCSPSPAAAAASSGSNAPTVAAAPHVYKLAHFEPAGPDRGRASRSTVSFAIQQPDGTPLTELQDAAPGRTRACT